ncbi:MAG: hypothetical protein ACYDG2_15065, partial [Ruminiclostridium sp.]
LVPAYDGHSFASQIISFKNTVNGVDEKMVMVGDLAYGRENFMGIDGSGVYVPIGIGIGSSYNMIKTFDEIMNLVDGKLENVIIGHESKSWELYPSWKTDDGLHVAEVCLAPGEKTRRK